MQDEEDAQPPQKKARIRLQRSVTKTLLENVSQYVREELLVPDIKSKVEKLVRFSKEAEERSRQKEIITEYVEQYIKALLRYRVKCSDAYANGEDDTSRVPISRLPLGGRKERTEGKNILEALKEVGFPWKLPSGPRIKSRNEFLMAFRCFSQHRSGKNFYPYLKPNEDLLKLPGFGSERESVHSMITKDDLVLSMSLWEALRADPDEFFVTSKPEMDLRITDVPGVNSLPFWKKFWKDYLVVSLQRNIEEALPSALRWLDDLRQENRPESWLLVKKNMPDEKTRYTELVLQPTSDRFRAIYEERNGRFYLRSQDLCVLQIDQTEGYPRRASRKFGFVVKIGRQMGRVSWSILVPGVWRHDADTSMSVQLVPFYRMTSEIRRSNVLDFLHLLYPSISRTIFSPENAPGIVASPHYLSEDVDGAAQLVFEHYREVLNTAQGEVLDKIMRALSTNQIPAGNTLIAVQGPPGTGKTTTIVGAVALLLAKLQHPEYMGRKILVCAASNAAVDVITRRLLRGIKMVTDDEKDPSKLNLVEKVPAVLRIGPGCRDRKLETVNLSRMVDKELDRLEVYSENERRRKRFEVEKTFLKEAQVWCSTLMNSQQPVYKKVEARFLGVIIDEASQALEVDCYMPLMPFGYDPAPLCVLVGDTKQLPPFENIPEGKELAEKGLMGRVVDSMQHTSNNCVRLQEQYRMHHAIAQFPGREFYSGHLRNSARIYDARIFQRPYHFDAAGRFGPVTFIDTDSMEDNQEYYPEGGSALNRCEARIAECLTVSLARLHQSALDDGIVLLSPYNAHLDFLCDMSRNVPEMRGLVSVSTSTVDSMQGDETGIIILSTVRSNPRKELGFLVDYRRMNVGMTRAKFSLIVIGNSRTLREDMIWRRFIEYCRDDRNECTHYLCPGGRGVSQSEACRKLFPESYRSSGRFWRIPRFQ